MAKTGIVGLQDDSDVVSSGQTQKVTDLGELIARLAQVLSVNRSGSLLDLVDFSNGLGQVTCSVSGSGSSIQLTNDPALVHGVSALITLGASAVNVGLIERDVLLPSAQGLGVEWWFATVQYTNFVNFVVNYYTGSMLYEAHVAYSYQTGALQLATTPAGSWYTVASVPLYDNSKYFSNCKLVFDPTTGYYNKLFFNGKSYLVNTVAIPAGADARAGYIETQFTLPGRGAEVVKAALGQVLVTQGEELAAC